MKDLEDMNKKEIEEMIESLQKTPWKEGTDLENDRLKAIEMLKERLKELE